MPVFQFNKLRHMEGHVSNSVALTVCRCSVLLKQEVVFDNQRCLAVIIVPATYVISNRHCSF